MPFARYGRPAAALLAAAGAAMLAWAALVLVWGDPFTAARTALAQRGLKAELADRMHLRQTVRVPLRLRAAQYRERLREGDAVGWIVVPRLGVNMVVVEGTAAADLARGPGHYRTSSLPGLGKTIAVAGHRTTYLQPFRHIDDLEPGDEVSLLMPYGSFRYAVYGRRIVDAHDWSILQPRPFETLVLTSCHPLFSASHRIVVYARLSTPPRAGAALGSA